MIIVTRGLPASGKTTWATTWQAADRAHRVHVNRDSIRQAMFGTRTSLTQQQENLVTSVEKSMVTGGVARGSDVVVDAIHLRPRYVRTWVDLAAKLGVDSAVVEFDIGLAEAKCRNLDREHVTTANRSSTCGAVSD